jgi:hypothetical protein
VTSGRCWWTTSRAASTTSASTRSPRHDRSVRLAEAPGNRSVTAIERRFGRSGKTTGPGAGAIAKSHGFASPRRHQWSCATIRLCPPARPWSQQY